MNRIIPRPSTEHPTTRDLPVEIPYTTLLFVDVQNFCAVRDGGEFKGLSPEEFEIRQDLIAEEAGQRQWAERLARLLPLAYEQLNESRTITARTAP